MFGSLHETRTKEDIPLIQAFPLHCITHINKPTFGMWEGKFARNQIFQISATAVTNANVNNNQEMEDDGEIFSY